MEFGLPRWIKEYICDRKREIGESDYINVKSVGNHLEMVVSKIELIYLKNLFVVI